MPKLPNHAKFHKVRDKEVVNCLGESDISNDEIVDTFIYSEATISNPKSINI